MLVISGTAGVGKTALAVHWAHQHAGGFPGGQLYVNLRGFGPADPLRPAEALRIFLDALAVPAAQIPATLDGRQSVYRSRLAGTKTLIVLDNAGGPDQVRPLLPGAPGCLVIVTSRNQLAGLIAADGAQAIVLDVLTSGEAHHVLARRLGPDRVAAEPAAAGELARLCARLPLALAVTGARAAARPDFTLTTLAAELRDTRGRLDALTTGEEDATDVRAVFSWSYHQLSTPAARMFQLLGLHPGPDTTAAAAASLAGLDPGHARRLLRELTHAHLLTEHSPGRYTSHDLLRAYAAEQADANHDQHARNAAIGRVLDHYLHTAHTAALLLNPSREPICLGPAPDGVTPEQLTSHQQALAWFEAEHHVAGRGAGPGRQVRVRRLRLAAPLDHGDLPGRAGGVAAVRRLPARRDNGCYPPRRHRRAGCCASPGRLSLRPARRLRPGPRPPGRLPGVVPAAW